MDLEEKHFGQKEENNPLSTNFALNTKNKKQLKKCILQVGKALSSCRTHLKCQIYFFFEFES